MCGRFFVESFEDSLAFRAIMEELNRRQMPGLDKIRSGEIAPGMVSAALTGNKDGWTALPMQWGVSGFDKRLLINARAETAGQTPTFAPMLATGRCLIPASFFFEWQHEGKKATQKYAVRGESNVLYLAGLFRQAEDDRLPHFVILTRQAEGQIAVLHDRMPVAFLQKEQRRMWLNDANAARQLLRDNRPIYTQTAVYAV